MAYLSGKDCAYLFVDGVNVAVSNNAVSISSEAVCPKRRLLGTVSKAAMPTVSGWLDTVTVLQLGDLTNDAKVVSVLFGGNVVSALFAGFKTAYVVGSKLGMADDDLDTFEPVLVTSDCKANIGYVVAPYVARTAAGNTDSAYATMTETSAPTGRAFLHVGALDLGGSTSCTITVRHSDDHITFGNHTAFTNVTAVGAETIALASTVNKYLSIAHAWVGAGAAQTITAFVGVSVD
jgi:hypothetical protein